MQVKKINIRNILGIDELEINAGAVTIVEGENGSGKTSVLEAVKAVLQGGHDATLLRNGQEKGEIVLLLDDGTELKKVVKADESSTTVTHPVMGKISRPAEFIKKFSDSLSVNPIEFLNADHKARAAFLLEALPLKVTPADFEGITLQPMSNALCQTQHPFVTIAAVYKGLYDERTGVNRLLKDKKASAEELQKTLPAEPPQNFLGQRQDALTLLSSVQDEHNELAKSKQAQNEIELKKITQAYTSQRDKIQTEQQKELDALNAEFQKRRDDIAARYQAEIDKAVAARVDAEKKQAGVMAEAETLLAGHRDRIAALKQEVATLDQKAQEAARLTTTRQLVDKYTQEAKQYESRSTDLSDRLARLETLKLRLASELPIPGIEVRDGEIYRDGVPFDRLNTAQQIEIAVKVAAIRAKELKLICVDGIEALDAARLKEFEEVIKANGLQAIVTRVLETGTINVKTI